MRVALQQVVHGDGRFAKVLNKVVKAAPHAIRDVFIIAAGHGPECVAVHKLVSREDGSVRGFGGIIRPFEFSALDRIRGDLRARGECQARCAKTDARYLGQSDRLRRAHACQPLFRQAARLIAPTFQLDVRFVLAQSQCV
ncbi:MAG TPA: hypothetical protein VE684_18180 [Crenalkalicoccus sp.]|nr:hypothetical protein [Crenalkalicoccus sp.]